MGKKTQQHLLEVIDQRWKLCCYFSAFTGLALLSLSLVFAALIKEALSQESILASVSAHVVTSALMEAQVSFHTRVLDSSVIQIRVEERLNSTATAVVTYLRFLRLLQDRQFAGRLTEVIVSHAERQDWQAVFWECPPVRRSGMDSAPFEFVLINAPSLATRQVDAFSFAEHFATHGCAPAGDSSIAAQVVSFFSLGRDAKLIVPCPPPPASGSPSLQHMTHLLAFLRHGGKEQIEEFWRRVGEELLQQLLDSASDRWFWLSTSGLGVSWLHARIDQRPKYYNYGPYKAEHSR